MLPQSPDSPAEEPLSTQEQIPQFDDLIKVAETASVRKDWKSVSDCYSQIIAQREAELALINDVQEGLSRKLDMQEIFNLVGDELRDTFNAQIVMISQYDSASNRVFHHYAIERGRHLRIQGWQPIDSSRLRIVQTAKPYMINQDEINRVLGVGMMKVIPGTEVPKTWLGVPMVVGDEVKGIVSLQNLDKENAFTKSDIALLATLTNSMALSLENARLSNETQRLLDMLEKEMEIARYTQQSILPSKLPKRPGYDFGSLMIPARAVGGDFYDFIKTGKHQISVVLGDVSDKGLPAALFMALTFSLIRAETERSHRPENVLINVNHHLRTMNASGMFVTLIYAVLDFWTGSLTVFRAGHLQPVIMDKNGRFLELSLKEGQPLGLFEDVKIDQQEYRIPPGGMAFLYSDGLNEAFDPSGAQFGTERIREILSNERRSGAQGTCDQLWSAVQAHCGDMPHQDDFTTVLIKRI